MSGHAEGGGPKGGRYARMKEKGANDIVSCPNNAFGFTILGRGVRARHAKENTVRCKEIARGEVIEFAAIITLDPLNRDAKLGVNVGKEIRQGGEGVGFET